MLRWGVFGWLAVSVVRMVIALSGHYNEIFVCTPFVVPLTRLHSKITAPSLHSLSRSSTDNPARLSPRLMPSGTVLVSLQRTGYPVLSVPYKSAHVVQFRFVDQLYT